MTRWLAFTTLVLTTGAIGCIPLPIPHTAQITPKLTGVLEHSDGSPIAGASIGVADKEHDTTCSQFRMRDTTDEAGRFRLPAMKVRRRIFWLSLMENFGMTGYWLCAQRANAQPDGTHLLRTSVAGMISGDSLRCLEWQAEPARHLTCESWVPVTAHFPRRSEPELRVVQTRIVEGGSWAEAGANGHYRILLADAPDRWGVSAFVQWLDTTASAGNKRVLATVPLPTVEPVGGTAPRFLKQSEDWYVAMIAAKRSSWGNNRPFVFLLGPPGTVRLIPDSTRIKLFPLGPAPDKYWGSSRAGSSNPALSGLNADMIEHDFSRRRAIEDESDHAKP